MLKLCNWPCFTKFHENPSSVVLFCDMKSKHLTMEQLLLCFIQQRHCTLNQYSGALQN